MKKTVLPERVANSREARREALDNLALAVRQTRVEMENLPGVPSPLIVVPREWRETPSQGVIMRVCALDQFSDNQTVCNVAVNPFHAPEGGEITTHTHDRFERIFVVEGEYTDSVSGQVYREGQTQEIAPHQPHGLRSDFALLFVTWRPAYPRTVEPAE